MSDITNQLRKKLHLATFQSIGLYNRDSHSTELDTLRTVNDLVQKGQSFDVIFVHTYQVEEMATMLNLFWQEKMITESGLAYLVYPKLNNQYYPGIHRDEIFPKLGIDDALGLMPGTHYKFNRMVRLNDVFTIIGIKHLSQKEVEKIQVGNNQPSVSGRVADYIQYLPDLETKLKEEAEALYQAFTKLTPGRQRNWAREIYSARTQTTRDKRFLKLTKELQHQN